MRDTLRDEVDLALLSIYAGKDFNPAEPRNPHTGEWINSLIPDFTPSVAGDQISTAEAINSQRAEFEGLSSDAVIQAWHGPAGAGSGTSSKTYVTLNYHQAKGFALGEEPNRVFVRKGDLEVSPEAKAAGFDSVADSLFAAGEAVAERSKVRFERRN